MPKALSLVVISAPSGAGKTTLNRRLVQSHDKAELSVSHTTRSPRPGEKDGVHYHFVSVDAFKALIAEDKFLEWAEVHGNFYGTSLMEITRIKSKGKVPILEIDVQGWQIAKPKFPEALAIFILPPTLKVLWQRLEKRGSEALAVRLLRIENAYHEIELSGSYDYFIVNDDIESAYHDLCSIVIDGKKGKIDNAQGKELCAKLKEEFNHADWIQGLRAKIGE